MPSHDHRDSRAAPPLVGIGASAGELEPVIELLGRLSAEPSLAVALVAQDAGSDDHRLAEALAERTRMRVSQAGDGTAIQPNHLYLLPPEPDIELSGDRFARSAEADARPGEGIIDRFFHSLATECQGAAIGVLLPGTDTDGAAGLAAIRAHGGLTFAQAEDLAGAADYVLRPEQIAAEILRLAGHPYLHAPAAQSEGAAPGDLDPIFARVRSTTGIDFGCYKESTVRRRLARRMMLRRVETIQDYLRYLDEDPGEARLLGDEILVHVTGFFRDPGAFEVLGAEIVPTLLESRKPGLPLRVWVPGCSTGEEVYSIAIVLLETLGDAAADMPIQIFGSDLSERAIEKARTGVYPEAALDNVSQARRRRFFTAAEGGLLIQSSVRELCVFAKHDVTRDPPFSRLDLISCRNLLIYFGPTLQQRVLPLFHRSLRQPGFLMLGQAETIGGLDELFSLENKPHKIYARKPAATRLDIRLGKPVARAEGVTAAAAPSEVRQIDLQRELDRFLVERYAPAAVLVNESLEVVVVSGRTGAYLELPSGPFERKLLKLARDPLVPDLRLVLHQATKKNAPARRVRAAEEPSDVGAVRLEAAPLQVPGSERYFVVAFHEVTRPEPAVDVAAVPAGGEPRDVMRLREELSATQEYVRAITDDHERAIADLASANEELRSTNEELQSTNEELDTTKEELESANEELTTLNEDLQRRNEELSEASSDIVNIFGAVDIPIVFVGNDLRIRRFFAPRARDALNLLPTDIGRAIGEIRPSFEAPDMEAWIREVIDTGTPREEEVCDREGRWHRLQIRPYRTREGTPEGAVIALVDVDTLRRSLDALRAAEAERKRRDEARAFLDEASAMLSSSLDYATTLANVAKLAVPRLGDWCAVEVFKDEELERLAVAHRDPAKVELARELRETYPPNPSDDQGVFRVMRTGQSQLLESIPDDLLRAAAKDEQHLAILRGLGLESALVVPMIAQERPLGAITFVYAESHRRYGDLEREVAEDLAYRAATAVNNAVNYSSRRELAAVVESAEDAIIRMNLEGIVHSWNAAAERIFGYAADEIVGRSITTIVPPEHLDEEREILARVRRGERVAHRDTVRVAKDGRQLAVALTISPVKDATGRVVGASKIARDISERKRAEEERARLLSELHQAVEVRDAFLSIASHELRTPLNTLKLQTEFVRSLQDAGAADELAPDKLRSRLEAISRQASRLTTLIAQLLDVSRITAGRLQLEPEEVDLGALAREVAGRFADEATRAGSALEMRLEAGVVGSWDRGRIDQVLTNLISNALKYGAGEPILVSVRRGERRAEVVVKDHGIGIAPEDQARLFQRFERIVSARHFGGFGLGLWIVAQFVRAHGGAIHVESEENQGSQFIVELPLESEGSP